LKVPLLQPNENGQKSITGKQTYELV
jgi:hypothetical protein